MTLSTETMSRIRSTLNALSEISLHLDGNTQPVKLPKPNFANCQYIQAHMSLFSGTGKENRDEGNVIAREDYPNGYALYAFDLSPDLAEEGHFNLVKQGTVHVELKFKQRSPTPRPSSPTPSLRTSSKSTAIETSSTTLAVIHEHYRNFRIFEQRFNL